MSIQIPPTLGRKNIIKPPISDAIIPIVIWYNPNASGENNVINNLETYLEYFNKVIIIDNSNSDNSPLILECENVMYFPNFENLGIAKALNQGCNKAIELGYDWVLTMDQDSNWGSDIDLRKYLGQVEKLSKVDKNNVSFSPDRCGQQGSILGDIKKSIKCKLKYRLSKDNKLFDGNIITPEFDFVDRVITSGNIINLRIWKRIGEFNEQLFIDEVDHEFCYRLRNQGYNIIQIHTCRMYHSLGINKRTLFSHHCQHEGIRLYYIMRNLQFIKKQYRGYFNEFHCQQYIRRSIFEKIMFLKFSDLKYMYQGIVDARENIFGKYKY